MNLCKINFYNIAKELEGLDIYQYTRAYSAGLQEFIEAFTFYQVIRGEPMSDWDNLQTFLTYKSNNANVDAIEKLDCKQNDTTLECYIQPTEFMLGLGDLTGEVMRRSINALGNGNIQLCNDSALFLKQLYCGYLRIIGVVHNREMSRKITTLKQSLLKTEMVCYNIQMRGGEAAVWSKPDIQFSSNDNDNDEGFF